MFDFDIVVVASRRRKPVIVDYLKEFPHVVSWTPDYDLPGGWKCQPEYGGLVDGVLGDQPQHHIGHNRCLRGHQDALKKATKGMTLVFEDDAIPNRPDWHQVAKAASVLGNEFEIISLFSHDVHPEFFEVIEVDGVGKVLEPKGVWQAPHAKFPMVWALGSVSYLITAKAREKLIDIAYEGLPMDLIIANVFRFCTVAQSPIGHDDKQKSLISP